MNKVNNKAQSLLELAIFGSLLIMLLGVLINYGLRYNFQHQVSWRVFRQALYDAEYSAQDNKPSSVSSIMIKDIHVPDPSSPTGIGQIFPVASSATSPIRSHRLYENPENALELNRMDIHVSDGKYQPGSPAGYSTQSFKTQAFRTERDVNERQYEKYEEIYGASNVWWDDLEPDLANRNYRKCSDCRNIGWEPAPQGNAECNFFQPYTGYAMMDLGANPSANNYYWCKGPRQNGVCAECWKELVGISIGGDNCTLTSFEEARNYPPGSCLRGPWGWRCLDYTFPIYILDTTAAEIIDKDSLTAQCRMIVDRQFCFDECNKARMLGQTEAENLTRCDEICIESTNRPNEQREQYYNDHYGGAWYCGDYVRYHEGTVRYDTFDFPVIEEIFRHTYKAKAMGLSPDLLTTTNKTETLSKRELLQQIQTRDSVYLNQATVRQIHYLNQVSDGGYLLRPDRPTSSIDWLYSNRTIDMDWSNKTRK